ncbi:MAG: O-sialoglycoprotein endopeptidase [Elusimicrobia bacterium]|nr:MAG: O-sialoglycoprotein endopeptidase [Elusimicrobiota bacterium]KAF0157842.1 MAG: O-sialoglycoprotein endopeptidase [Elusimicrobiota bacterium]
MQTLAIETTCDETAACVLRDGRIISEAIFSQIALHRRYSGVVPELASRAHLEKINHVVRAALEGAGIKLPVGKRPPTGDTKPHGVPKKNKKIFDAVAFSRGPGLPGAILVGRVAAQTAARVFGAPLIGVNHLEGHLLACEFRKGRADARLKFPLAALIVSGGHTELWRAGGYGEYELLGRTRDDAAGEAFDKVARLLGLGYPGGPEVERLALKAGRKKPVFPRPFLDGGLDFSFSGLKTAVAYYLQDNPRPGPAAKAAVCAAFQEAVADTLAAKAALACRKSGLKYAAAGGGVSANSLLRERMAASCASEGASAVFSEKKYCADNAAMIALAAQRRLESGRRLKHRVEVDPDLKIESWGR